MTSHRQLRPVFPYEIFSLIIDHLGFHPDYRQDLISLGNVCSAFGRIRRRLLFRELQLGNEPSPAYHKRLLDLIASNPQILTFTRHLVIHKSFSYRGPASAFDPVSSLPPGPTVYAGFNNIKKLSIVGPPTLESPYLLPNQPPTRPLFHCEALDYFIAKGCLTSLALDSIPGLPIIIILSQPNLLHLELRSCGIAPWHQRPPSAELQDTGFKLRTLRVSGRAHDARLGTSILYCRRLERLSWFCSSTTRYKIGELATPDMPKYSLPPATFTNIDTIDTSGSPDWLEFCYLAERDSMPAFPAVKSLTLTAGQPTRFEQRPSIEVLFLNLQILERLHFIIGYKASVQFPPLYIALQNCFIKFWSCLRDLYIHGPFTGCGLYVLEAVSNGLRGIQKLNVIETLVFNFTIDCHTITLDTDSDFAKVWRALDEVLTEDGDDFPNLKYVEICICIEGAVPRPPLFRLWNRYIIDHEARCQVEWKKGDYVGILDEPLKRLRGLKNRQPDVCCGVYLV